MIRDQETINALVDIIERFVRERLIQPKIRWLRKANSPTTCCKKCANWAYSA
jgi:hypothetical protein